MTISGMVLVFLLTASFLLLPQSNTKWSTKLQQNHPVGEPEVANLESMESLPSKPLENARPLTDKRETRSHTKHNGRPPIPSPLGGDFRSSASYIQKRFFVGNVWEDPTASFEDKMTATFVGVTNTIGGIYDADWIAILPINFAYGPNDTLYSWIQFAVHFWHDGSVDLNLQQNNYANGHMDYGNYSNRRFWSTSYPAPQTISVPYAVGHTFLAQLLIHNTTHVQFTIKDEDTVGMWTSVMEVPSTSVVYLTDAFSPATMIEGLVADNVTSIIGMPYLEIDIINHLRSDVDNSQSTLNGVDYHARTTFADGYWRWAAVSSSSLVPLPSVEISSIVYPSSIGLGQTATIDIPVTNLGGDASWMTIHVSFPSIPPTSAIEIDYSGTTVDDPNIYEVGYTAPSGYAFRLGGGSSTVDIYYPFVEGSSNWPIGQTRHLRVKVTPPECGDFQFFVKSVAAYQNLAIDWDPMIDLSPPAEEDQQSEFVYALTISVYPLAEEWSVKTPMPTPRREFAIAELEGKIYCVGGYWEFYPPYSNSNEVYDPSNDSWTSRRPMPIACYGCVAGVANGHIYVIGGQESNLPSGTMNDVQEYDPVTDTWAMKTPMPTARYQFAIGVVNNKIYAIGGYQWGTGSQLHTVEEYDPSTDSWTTKTPMPTARKSLAVGVFDDKIYAMGGGSGTVVEGLDVNEVYDPSTNSWTARMPLPTHRYGLAVSATNQRIYAIGGYNRDEGALRVNEEYDPTSDTWTTRSSMPTARCFFGAATVNQKIYAIGGWVPALVGANEEYSPLPPRNIAIINVTPDKGAVMQAQIINLTVTVQNRGTITETFNVTAFYNETAITLPNGKNYTTITLTTGDSTDIIITWNTTGVPYDYYTISAQAEPVAGESDTADNIFIDGTVFVTIVGDVDGDGDVDGLDLTRMCMAYGSTPADPKWDENCDVNGDGIIDGLDLTPACGNYGKTT